MALGSVTTEAVWSMDLLQAYQAAFVQDATVRAARATAEAGQEHVSQAMAQLLPNIAFSAGRNLNNLSSTQTNVFNQNTTTQQAYYSDNQSLTLRQPLYRKSLLVGLKQADHGVVDVNATLGLELQNLGVRVASAYMNALLAQDQWDLILVQKKSITVQLDAARRSLEAGSGTRTDIDEAQARLDWVLAQELEAHQNVDFTRRQIEVMTNQPVGKLATVGVDPMPWLAATSRSAQDWIEQAEGKSPEMISLQARLDVARLEVAKAQAGHYPTLDAVAQITRSVSENVTTPSSSYTNSWIGLQLNVPLYAGGYVNSMVRQASAEQTRAQELLEAVRRDVGVRVHHEFRGVTEGILRIKAREQAVRSAQQLVVSSKRSFEAGSRTALDILNAEEKKQLAQRDLAQARYEYLLSRIRLHALGGEDPRQSLSEVNEWLVQN